jgi:hypothetical protein
VPPCSPCFFLRLCVSTIEFLTTRCSSRSHFTSIYCVVYARGVLVWMDVTARVLDQPGLPRGDLHMFFLVRFTRAEYESIPHTTPITSHPPPITSTSHHNTMYRMKSHHISPHVR